MLGIPKSTVLNRIKSVECKTLQRVINYCEQHSAKYLRTELIEIIIFYGILYLPTNAFLIFIMGEIRKMKDTGVCKPTTHQEGNKITLWQKIKCIDGNNF